MDWARKLARHEGIMTGVSGGASFAVAMGIAEKAASGTVILVAVFVIVFNLLVDIAYGLLDPRVRND